MSASKFSEILLREIETEIGENKSFNLIFSARDGGKLQNFHKECDNKGPTLTLLYGKYNVLFGGYTSLNWTSGRKEVKEDPKAFIFFREEKDQALCRILNKSANNRKKSIIRGDDFGPTFGSSGYLGNTYDLLTFTLNGMKTRRQDFDNILQLDGKINFYSSYTDEEQLVKAPQINGGTLDIRLLEVYEVVDDNAEWRKKPTDEEVKTMKKNLLKFDPLNSLNLPSLNILLVGVINAGKSSLVNTLASALSGKVVTPARALDHAESVTNEIKSYRLHKGSEGKQANSLCIVDIRGYEAERSLDGELKLILSGSLGMGYSFPRQYKQPDSDDPDNSDDSGDSLPKPNKEQEIQLVCFVVDGHKFQTQMSNSELQHKLSKIIRAIDDKNVLLVSVVTKLDKLCHRINTSPEHAYNCPKANGVVKDVAKHLGLEEHQVFPIVNYAPGSQQSPGRDTLALHALDQMVKTVESVLPLHAELTSRVKEDVWKQRSAHFPEKVSTCYEQTKREMRKLGKNEMRILCVGPKHSGKTSFIDSVCSAMDGEVSSKAGGGIAQGAVGHQSRPEKFQLYRVSCHDESETQTFNIRLGDMPGFQEEGGVELKQIKLVIQGLVANRCKITDIKDANDKDNDGRNPIDQRKTINGVCLVFGVAKADVISEKQEQRLGDLTAWLLEKEIPFIVVITKTDELSIKVKNDLKEMFNCPLIKQKKESLQESFKFKDNIIFPVRNYVHENKVVPEMDALILDAFRTILKLAREHLEDMIDAD